MTFQTIREIQAIEMSKDAALILPEDIKRVIFEPHFHQRLDSHPKAIDQINGNTHYHLAIFSDICQEKKIQKVLPNINEIYDKFLWRRYFGGKYVTVELFKSC